MLFDFAEVLKRAYSLIKTRKNRAELGNTDNKNDCRTNLVDWQAKNNQLEHSFSGPSKLSDSIFQVPVVSAPLLVPMVSSSYNERKIDQLTNMI